MSILQALILGVVQGIAEFLPISSSGHLAVLQHVFKLQEVPPLFDIVLHIPSLLAVIIFFRKKIAALFAILFRWIGGRSATKTDNSSQTTDDAVPANCLPLTDSLTGNDEVGRHTIIAVIVTTLVTGAIGIFTAKLLSDLPIQAVCVGFLFTAALLIASGVFAKRQTLNLAGSSAHCSPLTVLQAAIIGFMQGVGTLPGVSRSGSTISGALFCGVNQAAAGEYSFIVSIPAILAAFVLELKDVSKMSAVGVLPTLIACAACFVAAYASLAWLMRIIKKGKLEWFAAYLIPLGILGLLLF